MSKKADLKRQVRLDDDVLKDLSDIQAKSHFKMSLSGLANQAARYGMGTARAVFNAPLPKKQHTAL
jgi:hypothetical protein